MAVMLKSPLVIETDADLIRVGRENAGYRFERDEDGTIIVSPTCSNGGAKSAEALGQLRDYAKVAKGKAFDSNTGFAIGPGVRVFCPAASWVSSERIASLTEEQRFEILADQPGGYNRSTLAKRYVPRDRRQTRLFVARGTEYAVAIDPLLLDFDAIIDA